MRILLLFAACIGLAGCATTTGPFVEVAPNIEPCPKGPPPGTTCYRGQDSRGAHYIIAMPAQWNGVLVVHAHGGPSLRPRRDRNDEDIHRWAIAIKAGYAWAASAFHQGGVAVTSAAEDTERVRRIFVQHIAQPKRTLLHGQSWGANVAAKAAELYAAPGARSLYDGVLLSNGVLAGGMRWYDFRLDLRAVYQYLCRNHPAPHERQYPVWMGLPKDATLTRDELAARVDDCLGVRKKPAERTPEQARRLKTIADVIKIPESSVLAHLNWATWHFQDIVQNRTGGRNPFGNERVLYRGSDDDAALNAGVARYRADPEGVRMFAADADLSGRIGIPVLTVHAVGDPTAFVEMEDVFRRTMEAGGSAGRLVQTFTTDREHSYLADPVYPTLFAALLRWIEKGGKPTPAAIAAECKAMEASFGPGCRFDPHYRLPSFESRVAPR